VARRSTTGSGPVQVWLGDEVLTSDARATTASPDRVWQVLANGRLFAQWAIGATQVCEVDDGWPEVGSRLHHAMGRGRFALRSETRVLASTSAQLLRLRTEAWPTAGSQLTITLEPTCWGTRLRIEEVTVAGADHVVPPTVHSMLLQWRSAQALRGLALLAEGLEP